MNTDGLGHSRAPRRVNCGRPGRLAFGERDSRQVVVHLIHAAMDSANPALPDLWRDQHNGRGVGMCAVQFANRHHHSDRPKLDQSRFFRSRCPRVALSTKGPDRTRRESDRWIALRRAWRLCRTTARGILDSAKRISDTLHPHLARVCDRHAVLRRDLGCDVLRPRNGEAVYPRAPRPVPALRL